MDTLWTGLNCSLGNELRLLQLETVVKKVSQAFIFAHLRVRQLPCRAFLFCLPILDPLHAWYIIPCRHNCGGYQLVNYQDAFLRRTSTQELSAKLTVKCSVVLSSLFLSLVAVDYPILLDILKAQG